MNAREELNLELNEWLRRKLALVSQLSQLEQEPPYMDTADMIGAVERQINEVKGRIESLRRQIFEVDHASTLYRFPTFAIRTHKRLDDWHACIEKQSGIWEAAETESEAIGRLIKLICTFGFDERIEE